MKIMVTGANGGYGQWALKSLRQFAPSDVQLYGLVRDQAKADRLREWGVTPRIGDYADLSSLKKAFTDIDRLLFVSVSVPNIQQNVVKAIQESDIQFVAYTSLYGLDHARFGLEINHRATEKLLQQSGVAYTFLRNNWYLEIAAPMLKAAQDSGSYRYYSGDGRIAWALKREYAEAGARVILGDHWPEVINLAGRPVTYGNLGVALGGVQVKQVTREQYLSDLTNTPLSAMDKQLTVAYEDYAMTGSSVEDQADPQPFEQVLRHPLTPLATAVREVINDPHIL